MKSQRYLLSETEPFTAVIVPVHNQEEIIATNLNALLESLTLPFEIVIVNDGSRDGTGREIDYWCENTTRNPPTNVCSIEIIKTRQGKFETWCDTVGINRTSAPYIIEIQADMKVIDKGFDGRLFKLMKSNVDLIALSGRGVEPFIDASRNFKLDLENIPFKGLDFGFSFFIRETVVATRVVIREIVHLVRRLKTPKEEATILPKTEDILQGVDSEFAIDYASFFPQESFFEVNKRAGRLGNLMEKQIEISKEGMNQIWVGESIMRGPLIIDRRKFIEIGGFNKDLFFLGHDDHDMARRAWVTSGFRVGFHPVNFTSPLNHGSTRKNKSFAKRYLFSKKRARMARKSYKSFLISHADTDRYNLPKSEVRKFK